METFKMQPRSYFVVLFPELGTTVRPATRTSRTKPLSRNANAKTVRSLNCFLYPIYSMPLKQVLVEILPF